MSLLDSYTVSARKYRPQRLTEILGQPLLVEALKKALSTNRIPHAFLFHGIRGSGKTTAARILAKTFNCKNFNPPLAIDPCQECLSCKNFTKGSHLDIIEMDAASRTGVDDIREIIESTRYKAVESTFKIFIIDEVHMLSKSAFNALLKTLEEPPPHVKFIFATTEPEKIPLTIMSRCARFDLKPISLPIMAQALESIAEKEGYHVEKNALSLLCRASEGSMRDALSLLDQAILLNKDKDTLLEISIAEMLGYSNKEILLTLTQKLLEGNIKECAEICNNLLNQGGDALFIFNDLLDIVYWLSCLKTEVITEKNNPYPDFNYSLGQSVIKGIPPSSLMDLWKMLLEGYKECRLSPSPSQTLQMTCMRICYTASLPPLRDLLDNSSGELEKKKSVLPENFEELTELLKNKKEMIFYNHLISDCHLVAYSPGVLTLRFTNNETKKILPSLKKTLDLITKHDWIFNLSEEKGEETLKKQEEKKHLEEKEKVMEEPILKDIKEAFPGTKFKIVEKEKNA